MSFGKGTPLFLIAGGPGSTHIGLRALDSLSFNNTLIFYDAFGRGKSDTAQNVSQYTLKRDISDLDELRKAMGYSKINILGVSFGTLVAQGYAIQYPDNVDRLILVSPLHSGEMCQEGSDNILREIKNNYPGLWDSLMVVRRQGYKSADLLHQQLMSKVPSCFIYAYNPDNLIKWRERNSHYPNYWNARLYFQMVGKDGDFLLANDIGRFDYRDDLKTLKMPVLIIAGRFDRFAIPRMMFQYKEYCPQAKLVIFEKSGHFPFIEESSKFFTVVRAFLKQ